MKKEIFPFLPMPLPIAQKLSAAFNPIANSFIRMNPKFKKELAQADIALDARSYYTLSVLSAVMFFIMTFFPILIVGYFTVPIGMLVVAALIFSMFMAGIVFFYYMIHPRLLISRKSSLLEKDLLFALKYMLIRIRSGVPLYDAMVGVAHGQYGEVSNEFKTAVKEMSGGVEEVKALENMALRTTSMFFRRTIWQIANNMRSGSDISNSLSSIIENLVQEQKIMIRRYGSELNPIILMYMMFSVIIPSLGVTVIIVMSSFSGITVPVFLFYLIPIGVFMLQIIFISIIRNKRPMLSIGV
jgi:flagellar protein FlaJ